MRTKSTALVLALACAGSVLAQEAPTATALMNAAKETALKEKKAVWVIFHASW